VVTVYRPVQPWRATLILVSTDAATHAELGAAVARARERAARSGELARVRRAPDAPPPPAEVGAFVRRILSDGTYARAVERIGTDDPDLATI
jgi:hypothetical protein